MREDETARFHGARGLDGRAGSDVPVAGIVLAAGSSSRLGRNKLLLEIAGEPLVRRVVRRAVAAALDPVLVVLGFEADRVRGAIADLPCRPVLNRDHAGGQPSSLKAGIAAVPAAAAAATVLLADMPRVDVERLRALSDLYRAHRPLAVVSDYGGVVAPPILYDRALFAELLALAGGGCAKRVLARHGDRTRVLECPPDDLVDVDLPADVERLEERPRPAPAVT